MLLRVVAFLVCGALAWLLPEPCAGVEPVHATTTSDTAPPDTITVRDTRAPQSVLDARSGMSSVREIDPSAPGIRSVADVLEEVVGVRVRRYGGLGSLATASIRGCDAGQVEVYLDGVPMNSAQFGLTNIGDLSLDAVSRIEVYRSHAPPGFGAPGIGGIINLVTPSTARSRTSVSLAGGSFGTRKARVLHAGRVSGTELLVSYTRLTADGDFDFTYDPGTPLNDTDDQARTRENNDLAEHAWLAKLRTRILGLRLTLMDDWLLSESGNPGFGNRLYRSARDETRRHTSSATLETPRLLSRRVRLSLTGFQAYQRNIYRNPDAEPGLSRFTETHRSRSLGARAHAEVLLPELSQTFTLSAERRRERFVPESESPYVSEGFERERLTTSLTIEDVLALVDGRVLLTGAFRHREARDNFFGPLPFGRPPEERESPHWASAHGPSFGVVVRPARALTLKANRSHHERFPTLFELFGTGGEVRSNPELVPETGVTWDGGAVYALGRGPFGMHGRLEVTAFRSMRDSLIVLIQDSATTFKPLNLSSAEVEGLELALDAGVPVKLAAVDEVRFSAAFTTQDARQHSHAPFYDDRWVPYVSPRELSLRTTLMKRLGATSLALRHEYAFFDRYYRDRANRPDRKVDERRVHDFGLRVGFVSDRFVVDLALENAFDERVQDVFGYPVPGRSFQLSTTFEIGR